MDTDPIVQVGHPVLREHAARVSVADIPSPHLQRVLRDMFAVLAQEKDGAALAAPQIGVSLRIFVLAPKVFGSESGRQEAGKDGRLVYINPEIIKRSRKTVLTDEGCLSVRGRYGKIKRHVNVTVQAYDEHGVRFTRGAGGLLAQAFQHECDHLDGTLFIDGAAELWEVDTPKR